MAAIKAPGFGDNRKAILQDSPLRELFFWCMKSQIIIVMVRLAVLREWISGCVNVCVDVFVVFFRKDDEGMLERETEENHLNLVSDLTTQVKLKCQW